jgi:proteasome accessory factor A
MCEYATALKVGTTRLVLDLIERGAALNAELDQPVAAVKQLSRDPDLKAVVRLKSGRRLSALELQEYYCEAARRELAGSDEESDWLLNEWSDAIRLLAQDRPQLVGKLDWVTKQWLLETFMSEERLGWDDPWLASLDLEYHNVDPEQGLYLGLEADGRAWRMTTDEVIEEAVRNGPGDTRGGLRGVCIQRFSDQISSMQWERIQFVGGIRARRLDMGDLFDPQEVRRCMNIFRHAHSPADALAAWTQKG